MPTGARSIANRTPDKNFSRKKETNLLSELASLQIIVDLEDPELKGKDAREIIESNPSVYGDPNDKRVVRALRDRIRRLQRSKGRKPRAYL